MDGLQAFALVVGSTAVAAAARRFAMPAPIVLVLVGIAVSLVPGVPVLELDPELVLVVFLPPLLYSAALDSSYIGFKANKRAILLLSVGLVLFTTVVVGFAVHALIPELPLSVAFVLGAIVAPPDAVAATAIGRRVGLPRRLVTILGGESLVNDGTALTAYRVAVAAALGEGFSLLSGALDFVVIAAGGILFGLVVGPLIRLCIRLLRDPILENTAGLITPFAVYLAAEFIHVSGVLAVVVVGLYLGHHADSWNYAARLQGHAIWALIDFVLEAVVFALIGLQLRVILDELVAQGTTDLLWYATVVFLLVVLTRFAWVFPATYLPRILSKRIRERDPAPPWTWTFVVSWAGMRGVVSLAAAFAIPLSTDDGAPFPGRDMVLFLSFAVIVGTLVIQGLSLPWVIRKLGVAAADAYQDRLTEAQAQQLASQAALDRLDALLVEADEPPSETVVEQLREAAELRQLAAWERLGGAAQDESETPSQTYRRLRREMLAAEREVLVQLRDERRINDEVLRQVQRDLDLEEALLERD